MSELFQLCTAPYSLVLSQIPSLQGQSELIPLTAPVLYLTLKELMFLWTKPGSMLSHVM